MRCKYRTITTRAQAHHLTSVILNQATCIQTVFTAGICSSTSDTSCICSSAFITPLATCITAGCDAADQASKSSSSSINRSVLLTRASPSRIKPCDRILQCCRDRRNCKHRCYCLYCLYCLYWLHWLQLHRCRYHLVQYQCHCCYWLSHCYFHRCCHD